MIEQRHLIKQVEHLIRLVKKGDRASLTELRQQLDKSPLEVAQKIGVSQAQLDWWEKGEQEPTSTQYILWKLKLSYYIDDVISELLGTADMEINTHFWELMWSLLD